MRVELKRGTLNDLFTLKELVSMNYIDTCDKDITQAYITEYIDKTFTIPKLSKELTREDSLFYLMYVDKKLDGVKTVQTLSRLNRTYPNKQTFVLDFQNSVEDIQDAYKPYFEMTNIDKVTDPNVVNDLWYQLHEYGIYNDDEINEFTILFYKEKRTSSQDAKMNSLIDKAVERYCYLEEEDEKRADEFKKK